MSSLAWVAYVFVLFVLYVRSSVGTPLCFGDCQGYVVAMGLTPLSPRWTELLLTTFRSFTIPAVFSLFGRLDMNSAMNIMFFQTLLSFGAWIGLGASLASLARSARSRALLFVGVTLLMFGRGAPHFNQFLLSDSISFSLIAIWLALLVQPRWFLTWIRGGNDRTQRQLRAFIVLAGLIGVSALASGARDANVLLMAAATPIAALRLTSGDRRGSLVVFAVVLALGAQVHGRATERSIFNSVDVVAGYVVPSASARSYFHRFGGLPLSIETEPGLIEPISTEDPNFLARFDDRKQWIERHVPLRQILAWKRVWTMYLGSHPGFVASHVMGGRRTIFSPEVSRINDVLHSTVALDSGSRSWPLAFAPGAGALSPVDLLPTDVLLAGVALAVALASIFSRRSEPEVVAVGLVLVLAGASNAVISYFGDHWQLGEMGRHCFHGSIVLRVGFVMLVASLGSIVPAGRSGALASIGSSAA